MALMFGMTSLATYAMFTWMPRIFTEAGASPAFGGAMVALYTGFSLLGGLVVPGLAVRMRNSFPLALACALAQFAGFYGLWQAPMAAPWLWATLVGIGGCTFPLGLTLINLRTRTPQGSAALSGFTQGLGYSLACLGPLLFGILKDATGGLAWPFAMLAASVVAMLAGAWQACRPRVLEDGMATAGAPTDPGLGARRGSGRGRQQGFLPRRQRVQPQRTRRAWRHARGKTCRGIALRPARGIRGLPIRLAERHALARHVHRKIGGIHRGLECRAHALHVPV